MNKAISIIGFGNMGSAFYSGLKKKFPDNDFWIYDRNDNKLSDVSKDDLATNVYESLLGDIIILAIKPQSFESFAESAVADLNGKLVISMMAGIDIKTIQHKLNATEVVRCMPNLPVQLGQGVIGWYAPPQVSTEHRDEANEIFSALGKGFELSSESMLSSLTLISGCGPAYFYYLVELLADQAKSLGFSDDESRLMAESTLIGSAELLKSGNRTSTEWKKAVASKGGVTEAALETFKSNGLNECFIQGLEVAKKRNEELNQ